MKDTFQLTLLKFRLLLFDEDTDSANTACGRNVVATTAADPLFSPKEARVARVARTVLETH